MIMANNVPALANPFQQVEVTSRSSKRAFLIMSIPLLLPQKAGHELRKPLQFMKAIKID